MNLVERGIVGFAKGLESFVGWWTGLFGRDDEFVVIVYDSLGTPDIKYVIGPFSRGGLKTWQSAADFGIPYAVQPLIRTWLTPGKLQEHVRERFEMARDKMTQEKEK